AAGSSGPAVALAEDKAVLAVLSLEELASLRKGARIADRYGIAALPGAAAYTDPKTGALVPIERNYIPYVAGGWLGVVRKSCQEPDRAFDLLAELGGPARSLEFIAAGGYGPIRDSHLEA